MSHNRDCFEVLSESSLISVAAVLYLLCQFAIPILSAIKEIDWVGRRVVFDPVQNHIRIGFLAWVLATIGGRLLVYMTDVKVIGGLARWDFTAVGILSVPLTAMMNLERREGR